MRSLLIVFLSSLWSLTSLAVTKTAIANSGQGWGTATNWSPAGVPQDGDMVIIPFGFTLSVKGSLYTGTTNISLAISGTLQFEPSGKLNLGGLSTVQVMSSMASITTANSTGSELISINGVAKYRGDSDGTIIGPAFSSAATGTSPSGFVLGSLPIHLQSFTAQKKEDRIILQWQIAPDDMAHHFIIERSPNGVTWQPIQEVDVKGTTVQYMFMDANPLPGNNFYRLKMVENDGDFTYSSAARVYLAQAFSFRIRQHRDLEVIKVRLPEATQYPLVLHIISPLGQLLQQAQYAANDREISISTRGLPKGCYYLRIQTQLFTQSMGFQQF